MPRSLGMPGSRSVPGMLRGWWVIAATIEVHALTAQQYLALIQAAPAAGVRGGSFFDAIHAQVAREARCEEIHTLNLRHFKHVAPDLKTVGL